MEGRRYSIGVNPKNKRETLTVHNNLGEIPFSVYRDLARLANQFWATSQDVTFEFLVPGQVPAAERVLQGALWEKKVA